MIQRKQSLFLLLAALCMGLMLLLPLAYFTAGSDDFVLRAFALYDQAGTQVHATPYLGVLLCLAAALPLAIVFFYRNRMLQMRLCVAEFVLLVGSEAMACIYYYLTYRAFAQFDFHLQRMGVWIFLPLAAVLFNWLALRGIYRDELLVRSADRIR